MRVPIQAFMIDFVDFDFDNSTIPFKISQPYVSSALGGEETKEGDDN